MKKKFVAMSLLFSTVLMISACGSNVEDAQASASTTVNESVTTVTAEPATVPTVEPTVEPTTTPDEKQSAIVGDSNSGSYNTSISTEDTSYCTFESIEPTTLYAKYDGTMFGNPNLYEGQLVTEGGFGAGDELTFNHKVTYNDVEYYVIKNDAGLILMVSSDCLSETPVEIPTETPATEQPQPSTDTSGSGVNVPMKDRPVINDKYEPGSMASKLTDEQIATYTERLRNNGWSEDEINETLYSTSNGPKITEEQMNDPEIARRLRGEYTEEELEALKKAAGMTTH